MSHNPFILLQHLKDLSQSEVLTLKLSIKGHLEQLSNGADEGTFSSEQMAEMKILLSRLTKLLLALDLGKELTELSSKL